MTEKRERKPFDGGKTEERRKEKRGDQGPTILKKRRGCIDSGRDGYRQREKESDEKALMEQRSVKGGLASKACRLQIVRVRPPETFLTKAKKNRKGHQQRILNHSVPVQVAV